MGRILVVDDHDSLRKGLVRALVSAGHDVEEAPNGTTAIERLQDSQFDVVLTDLRMGGADGMVFHKDALTRLKDSLREQKARTDRIDVARFKELFGVTRKHAIPLLEWLDRERVTQRSGNERLIL